MYAHIRTDDDKILKQTVEEHLENTAKIGRQIGKAIGLENMAFLACLFHDMGKNKEEFNQYIIDSAINGINTKKGKIDHSSAGGQYIFNHLFEDNHNNFTPEITAELLTVAIFSHHGLMDVLDESIPEEIFLKRCNKKDIGYEEAEKNCAVFFSKYDIDGIKERAVKEAGEIVNVIKERLKGKEPYFMLACLQRLITSIVMDADRKDTAEFMTGMHFEEINDYDALWRGYIEKLNNRLSAFKNTNNITELRRKMSDECFEFAKNGSGIYCLPIPTGGGKTLASLRFALEHCRLHGKQRIIYTAPYLSILEQNADEVRNILNDDEHILEHHSNVVLDNDDENYDGKNIYKYLSDTWDSPVILTTMVRFLDILLCYNSTDVRRFCKLCNSVIIIDEVQNIPVKAVNLFNLMLNFLAYICNSTVVLCSATQPLLGRTIRPVIYGSPKEMIKDTENVSDAFKRTRIVDMTNGGIKKFDTVEFADFVLDKADDNILIILNTKSAVKKLYDELMQRDTDYDIYQLTTLMCPQHRKDVISEIKGRLGKDKLICISTQLIEAGVDISFNNVVRSLSGLDSIIQAAGRCNRNGRTDIREVYIVEYSEENVKSLTDINKAQAAMRDSVLPYFREHRSELGDDWLLTRGAERYYKVYFFNRENEMDYNIDGPINMYNMLSSYRPEFPRLANRYKSAGKAFRVIDSDTIGIIVPYKEGKEKLDRLIKSSDISEIRTLLKELQRYTVNINRQDKKLLELKQKGAIEPLPGECGYVLSPGFYDNNAGVKTELDNIIF